MKSYSLLLCLLSITGLAVAQVTATEPDPIILCDVNNPGDQMEIFDLTIRESQIIGSQTNVVVTYHLTSGDALGNGGFIEFPESFENTSDPQNIFIRVENVSNPNDWEITVLILIVPFIPEIVTPAENITLTDTNDDGFEVFDLTRDEANVLGGQDPFEFTISYFVTQADADANMNTIADPENYTNVINPQTIYTRFAPLQDQCQYESYSFEIFADNVLAIDDIATNQVVIYPNPVSDRLHILASNLDTTSTVDITNINGSVVLKEEFQGSNSPMILTVDQLPTGIYFVRVTSEGVNEVQKLIKK